jgi:hypothetical protein
MERSSRMDLAWGEGLAVSLYRRLGLDPSEPVSPFVLATKWLGERAVIRPVTPMTSPAMTFILDGRRRIALKRNVAPNYAAFYVGHELGHALLHEEGYVGEYEEQLADLIGAALLAPMPAVRSLMRSFDGDLQAIADAVHSTSTWAALRTAEAMGITRAVIAPQSVRVRGPEAFVWPAESTLRQWAEARKIPAGLAKTRLKDDRRRIVIDVEEAG